MGIFEDRQRVYPYGDGKFQVEIENGEECGDKEVTT